MKKKVFVAVFFCALFLFFFTFGCTNPSNSANPGSLDTTFSGDEKVTTPIGSSGDIGSAEQ